MKRLVLTLMICLGCFGFLEAQNVWKTVEMPGEFLGVSANGDMFCQQGYSGTFRSSNEGVTWDSIYHLSYVRPGCFIINDFDRIFIFNDNNHRLVYSDDNGDTWQEQTTGISTNWVEGMFSLSNDTIFMANREKFFWTFDGGESWNETPIDFVGDALFGSILADHAGNVYLSTYSWTYPVDHVGIYTATVADLTQWTMKSSGGAREMAFDSEGYILASSPGTFHLENGIYWVNADRFALTSDDVIFAMKRLDNYSESLFYSTDHGETYTRYGESIPQSHGAPDPDLGLFKGRDNHLYCHSYVWDRDEWTYYKSIRVVDMIVNPDVQFQEGWQTLQTGITEDLFGVYCVSQTHVLACGENGKIVRTTNGGISWDVVYEKPGYDMIHIAFSSDEVGYACGDSCAWDEMNHKGIIVKTTDGGATWYELPNTEFVSLDEPSWTQNNLFRVTPYYDVLYLFDDDGVLWRSDNGGQSFTFYEFDYEFDLGRIDYCDMYIENMSGCLIVVDVDWEFNRRLHVFNTDDDGLTWTEKLTLDYVDGFQIVARFLSADMVELYGFFNNGENNLLVTNNGFETYYFTNTESINLYSCSGDFARAKFSDPYDCILFGSTLTKGSTEWNPVVIIEGGWLQGECTMNHFGIPDCYYAGTTQCFDLNCIDGLGTTFFIAGEEGIVLKLGMVPVGGNGFLNNSEWYYEIGNENGSITYQYLYQAGDTVVQDEPTHILVRINTLYDKGLRDETTHEYVYERDGKVYWWNKTLEEFTVLYDFNAQVGDGWEIKVGNESLVMRVDAEETIEYEGNFYRMLHVIDADDLFSGDIICGIGHLTSFFPERLMNNGDGIRVDGLRCYWINDEQIYNYGDEDCDAIYSEIHGLEEDGPSTGSGTAGTLVVYPNPTNGVLNVSVRLPQCDSPTIQTYRIANIIGQNLLQGTISAENQQIDVTALPEGMYFITVGDMTKKFVVNR